MNSNQWYRQVADRGGQTSRDYQDVSTQNLVLQ
jgi:hypothetical protein